MGAQSAHLGLLWNSHSRNRRFAKNYVQPTAVLQQAKQAARLQAR